VELETSGVFVLRTPACPMDDWLDLGAGLTAATSLDREVWRAERDRLREQLRRLVLRADVQEAIFVASPSLNAGIGEWLRDPEGERGQKVERALVRYVARMTGRATPFGLFAGWSIGIFGTTTALRLRDRSHDRRHSRLDNDLLAELAAKLAEDLAIRRQLRVTPNDTIYRLGEQLRYVTRRFAAGTRVLELAAVDAEEHVIAALARSVDQPRADELARALAADEGVPLDEAQAFVDELLDEQLLLSDLDLPVTGTSPLASIIAALPPAGDRARDVLVAVQADLARLDEEPIGVPVDRYRSVIERLAALAPEPSRALQIDLARPADGLALGAAPLAELTRAVKLLHRIAPRRSRDLLADFRAAFHERYGPREVRLVEALDEESGIGFERANGPSADPSPLLAGVRFGVTRTDDPLFTARDGYLLRRIGATAGGELCLDDDDLAALEDPGALPLPDAFAVRATLAAASSAAVDAGDFLLYVQGVNGPSGGNLLGRFCGADHALTAAVMQHLRAEEAHRPDAIFAEILHLPEGRLANLVLRPSLRAHELRLLGRSGLPHDQQLTLDDLRVSVIGDRVVLRSARLDREVIPRLTTAHNFATRRSLGIYRFLCALQHQGTAAPSFQWGPLASAAMLPRVRHGRIVLSLARWRLDARQLSSLGDGEAAARFAAVQRLRGQLGLPRRVSLVESDHVLPVDLDHALSVESFARLVHRRDYALLTESFPAPDQLCVESPAGHLTHELLVPMQRRPSPSLRPSSPAPPRATLQRRFIPGSEWLSFKIYPADDLERLLTDVLAPVIADVVAAGAAERWFFLRYNDPEGHVRLRFGGPRQRLAAEVLPRVNAALEPLVADERVWRVQLGTYTRELERYGGDAGMAVCEEIFCADSEAALALLRAPHTPTQRWQWTLRGMQLLLDDLDLELPAQAAIAERAREIFFREFGGDPLLARTIGARHRELRAELEALFASDGAAGDVVAATAFGRRTQRIAKLRARPDWPAATVRAAVAGSLLHMHANRMLRGAARAWELVLYDFLWRHYRSVGKRR
jgi:lantibiotic biosynthesis protein